MTKDILANLLRGIKGQIKSQENLQTCLLQANALAYVGDASDFEQISQENIHHYLCVLMEILEKASLLSEHITHELDEWVNAIEKEEPPVLSASPA